jgi:hypothetical protein
MPRSAETIIRARFRSGCHTAITEGRNLRVLMAPALIATRWSRDSNCPLVDGVGLVGEPAVLARQGNNMMCPYFGTAAVSRER